MSHSFPRQERGHGWLYPSPSLFNIMSDLILSHFETNTICQHVETLQYLSWVAGVIRDDFHSVTKRRIPSDIFRNYSFRLDNEWYADMARKKSNDTNTERPQGNIPTDWSNIRLSDDDTPIILERATQWTENVADLFSLFASGYDVFAKRRDGGQTVQVTIIGANTNDVSRNVGMSAYAPDIETAVAALLYKYFDIAGEKPENFLSSKSGGIG